MPPEARGRGTPAAQVLRAGAGVPRYPAGWAHPGGASGLSTEAQDLGPCLSADPGLPPSEPRPSSAEHSASQRAGGAGWPCG